MNSRRTLRKAIAGLLRQTASNSSAVPTSSDRTLTDASGKNNQNSEEPKNS